MIDITSSLTIFFIYLVSGKKQSSNGHQSKPRSHAQAHLAMTKRISREAMNSPSSNDDVPSYMRSTSSSTKKEKPGGTPGVSGSPGRHHQPQPRRRSSINSDRHQTQSTSDLRQAGKDEDTSSEENVKSGLLKPNRGRRSSSQDR